MSLVQQAVSHHRSFRGQYTNVALVLQGGGALGAYQGGVYQALSEAGCEPDWLCGISIGSINAAIIAGNPPDKRVSALRSFWHRVTGGFVLPAPEYGDASRRYFNAVSAVASLLGGQPDFFTPRFPPAILRAHGSDGAISVYDTSPLKATLEELIDFDLLNSGQLRLSLGAVNIRTGNFIYFDTQSTRIRVEHVMASGALPPGFPPVEIDGEHYWDGGLVSNTPLVQVLDGHVEENTLVFQVDLFSARGDLPGDVLEAEERRKHISFSSRTRLNTDQFREKHRLRQAIVKLFERLPSEARQEEEIRRLRDMGNDHEVAIVHLIYRRRSYEGQAIDFEFSRASMLEHWAAGLNDAHQTLQSPQWLGAPNSLDGVQVFDILRDKVKSED
ncbi:MAG: DUF3734 domain-containing protein [Hyphomicrobiaceae bacterium]